MWMALRRHDYCSEHPAAEIAPCTVEAQPRHHEWVANRADECDSSLRRRS
jgi:hypothetical protein